MTQKIIIPVAFLNTKGHKVLLANNAQTKLFSDPDKIYSLDIKNKRQWITVPAEFLHKLNVNNSLEINIPNCTSVEFKMFEYYFYPQQEWYCIPTKKLTISAQDYLNLSQLSNYKINKNFNKSPLEELTLNGQKINTRLQSFAHLKKITFGYDQEYMKNLSDKDYFYNNLTLKDLPSLKEIDLTTLKKVANGLYFDFEKIPPDCKIKFDATIIKQIKGIHLFKFEKNRLSFSCHVKSTLSTDYKNKQTVKITDIFQEYQDKTGIIEIEFSKLKEIIKEQYDKHVSFQNNLQIHNLENMTIEINDAPSQNTGPDLNNSNRTR